MINKEKIEFLLLKNFSKLFKLIGLNGSRNLGNFLGLFFYYFIPIRKTVVIQNLSTAFPYKTPDEIRSIARKNFQSIFTTFFEFMYFPFSTTEEMKSILTFPDQEKMRSLINEKKGLVFWSGHLGSWEIAAVSGALVLGVPFYVMAKKQSNDPVNNWLTNAREIHGNKMIWLGASIRHLIEALRSGGVVGIVADQRGPAHNPRVKFFNKPTAWYTGTATIIARTNCNAILAVAVRQPDKNYIICMEQLNTENLPENFDERIVELNQHYANFLEKIIKQYPEQYFWMHKLWKY